ncbi:MAG: aminotransferase class V-fold PLP-dependent enzyme [Rhodospirillaceae bacterium]|nr:aminotransferase class V-fold PLP-dependent enzyme [Rhodospirillaceae bacterium]
MAPSFGRAIRSLWGLKEDATFLNHGSFGACPFEVLAAQERLRREMESQPDLFFRERIIPREKDTELRAVAAALGAFVHAKGDNIAVTESASAGTQAVLRSVKLKPGDRILVTHHGYNAVRLMVEARCAETGATPLVVHIPVPTTAAEVVTRITAALTPDVKLAIIDHITSPTALVLPVERIIPALRKNGTRVLIDGAHSIGQIPLDITALQPDWYVTNAHKWLFAPKGSAFLYAAPDVAPLTQPHIVSHFVEMGFPKSFDYMGTRDNTAWLAIPAAIKFFQGLGPDAVWAYQRTLIAACRDAMRGLGAESTGPVEMFAAMGCFMLPQRRAAEVDDRFILMRDLWDHDRIQTAANVLDGKLLLRISAQVYNDANDIKRLVTALDRLGWPGR